MILDIPTLAIVQALILLVEVFILYIQFRSGNKYIGVRLWMTGSILMAFAVLSMPLVKFPSFIILAILSNPVYIIGLLVIYQGIVYFMGAKTSSKVTYIIFIIFIIPYFFFIFVHNNMWARNLIVNITHLTIFSMCSFSIIKNRKPDYYKSSLFTAGVFIYAATFSFIRILLSLNKPLNIDYFELGISLPLAFLIYAIISILWTFGFILIHVDRLGIKKKSKNNLETKGIVDLEAGIELQNNINNLSIRELELVVLLNQGLTYEQIATNCFISKNTVKSHLKSIYAKYNVTSRINLLLKIKNQAS